MATIVDFAYVNELIKLPTRGSQRARAKLAVLGRELIRMYEEGISIAALERQYGIYRLASFFKRNGVKLRDRGERSRLRSPESNSRIGAARRAKVSPDAAAAGFLKAALTREGNARFSSDRERLVYEALKTRGLDPIIQKAVNRYNVDLAIPPVAVEIVCVARGGNVFSSKFTERLKDILGRGWHVVIVHLRGRNSRASFLDAGKVANYLVALLEQFRREPPASAEYRVIWGNGEPLSRSCLETYHLPLIPAFRDS